MHIDSHTRRVVMEIFLGGGGLELRGFYWLGIRVMSHSARSLSSSGEAECTKSG